MYIAVQKHGSDINNVASLNRIAIAHDQLKKLIIILLDIIEYYILIRISFPV